ncbi:hypothetical protein PHLGIDRAFT_123228 [Phlebiopsis gigantea 11061_1 CR5-6]|uniref:F-box domain-containing protein n=1 Tax=Phlebiopsis gigantea (strain 11061_1 CR5-6) TaxID=745531 RepID=A0A0C3PA07_PHLG1|nr:hypothetical protein PHLGIDRAFT_123228 [Phlebiopsis gigantea 11061_1 CR5-6]
MFPIEICEFIIAYIAEDPGPWNFVWPTAQTVQNLRTLQACSLTCRDWAVITRRYLFRSLGVRCGRASDRNLDALYTRVTEKQPPRSPVSWLTVEAGPDTDPGLHAFPLRTPQYVPSLEYLRLRSGVLYPPPGRVFEVAMKQFTSVVSLTLSHMTFHSVHDVRRMICALSRLEALIIFKINWRKTNSEIVLRPAYPPAPKTIRLHFLFVGGDASWQNDVRSVYLVEWLGRTGICATVQTLSVLHLMACSKSMIAAMRTVIETARDLVRNLILGWAPDLDFDIAARDTPLPRLQHPTTRLAPGRNDAHLPQARILVPPVAHMRPAVQRTPPRPRRDPPWAKLTKVEVQHHGVQEASAAPFAWGDVPTWLPHGAAEAERLHAELRTHMPQTHARGLLRYSRNAKPDRFAPV